MLQSIYTFTSKVNPPLREYLTGPNSRSKCSSIVATSGNFRHSEPTNDFSLSEFSTFSDFRIFKIFKT